MDPTMLVLIVVGAGVLLLLIIAVYVGSLYNGFVKLRNRYENAFGQIDVQLKRRHDLIPNLVEVAKGYMAHEHDTLAAVIAARNQAVHAGAQAAASPGDPAKMQALMGAEGSLVS